MTKEELAAKLNGREYGEEITDDEEAQAKAVGLVVVFGYSDDNAELRGAIHDEVGMYGGGEILIVDGELWDDDQCADSCAHAELANRAARVRGIRIEAEWGEVEGYSWTYETIVPHATFDVMEGDDKFCRGIVFELPQ